VEKVADRNVRTAVQQIREQSLILKDMEANGDPDRGRRTT
jgi:hypothetical protein